LEANNKNKKQIELADYEEIIVEKLNNGGKVEFTITGNSMTPLLYNKRDSVVLKKKDSNYKKGDIIFYKRKNGQYILHRIVGKNKNGFILCGDFQRVLEYSVKDEQIFGFVVEINRKGKIFKIDSKLYKIYSSFWMSIRPYRKIFMIIINKVF